MKLIKRTVHKYSKNKNTKTNYFEKKKKCLSLPLLTNVSNNISSYTYFKVSMH